MFIEKDFAVGHAGEFGEGRCGALFQRGEAGAVFASQLDRALGGLPGGALFVAKGKFPAGEVRFGSRFSGHGGNG